MNIDVNKLMDTLQSEGFSKVIVEYCGSGDDGGTESITGYKGGSECSIPNQLQTDCDDLLYEFMEKKGFDSGFNGDGSSGELVIDVDERELKLEHNEYYMESTTHIERQSYGTPV